MKLPAQIHVGGHTYQIKLVHDLWLDDGDWGCAKYKSQIIELDDSLENEDLIQTFLHEILHTIDKHYLDKRFSEDVINALAEGLLQVFKDMNIVIDK